MTLAPTNPMNPWRAQTVKLLRDMAQNALTYGKNDVYVAYNYAADYIEGLVEPESNPVNIYLEAEYAARYARWLANEIRKEAKE